MVCCGVAKRGVTTFTQVGRISHAPPATRAPAPRRGALMSEGTSRGPTKTLRFPAGSDLLAWFDGHARATGLSTNATLVLALEKYRAGNGAPLTEGTTQ